MVLTPIALLPHEHPRRAVFSPDGARLVIADDKRLAIYDRDGAPLAETILLPSGRLQPHVFGIAWSPDDAHIVTAENDALRLRRASDLSVIIEKPKFGRGPLAFSGPDRLALASWSELHVVDVPSLADQGSLMLEWGKYDSFDIDHVVAHDTFVAASDYGGWSEDEWGHTADRGIPKVTIIDATAPTKSLHDLTQPQPITLLELDRWRRRLLVGNYSRVVVRDLDAKHLVEWRAYGEVTINALAVCDAYVATMPDVISRPIALTIDLWDPTTYEHRERTPFLDGGANRSPLLSMRPRWLSASPDGARLLTHEPGGVRIFAVAT